MVAEAEHTDDITVLIVDDSEFFADMLTRELRDRAALNAESCYSSAAAIEALADRDDIDCVVSDYLMPDMDGLALLEDIRTEHDALPFIILTGQGSENVASKAIKKGATDYITKGTIIEDSEFGLLLNRIEKGVTHYRTERALRKNRTRLQERTEQLTVLNKMLRHDVRNDLQLVLGYLDQLDECSRIDSVASESLEAARDGAENAVETTDTAGDMVTEIVDSGAVSESIAVRPTVRKQVQEIARVHSQASVEIAGSIPSVSARASKLFGTAVRNLINNGIEHNDRPDPRIVVSGSVDDGRINVCVADNGPGIPDRMKERLLSEGETGPQSNGTGIGLYLVATFVDRHGGSIRIADRTRPFSDEHVDQDGVRGSVFTLTLPAVA